MVCLCFTKLIIFYNKFKEPCLKGILGIAVIYIHFEERFRVWVFRGK
jgi:hypothetical protein